MALQSSGQITLKEIATEFEDTAPSTLKEFYSAAVGIPSSGTISLKDFYGASNAYAFTISSDTVQADVNALALADGWDGVVLLNVTVASGVWLYSNTTSYGGINLTGSFPNGVSVVNNGNIIGMGGYGGQAGGPAVKITTTDTVNITNNSGAYIAGGGGGGGGSYGGGGAGQSGALGATTLLYGGWINTSGGWWECSGCTGGYTDSPSGSPSNYSQGYGGGGGGTQSTSTNFYCTSGNPGCGGNAYFTNSGAPGGRALTGGGPPSPTTNGGGFWGTAGNGSGAGAGGAAISGTYNSYTDNGTTYGTT